VVQHTRVVVEHLGEDETPEPAQPLTVGEHGGGAASRLVSRLEHPLFHTSMVESEHAASQDRSR
jgi:hypothetical protein